MRAILNEILHGIGYLVFAIGLLICGESLLSTLDPIMSESLLRYAVCGIATTATGLLYIYWKI